MCTFAEQSKLISGRVCQTCGHERYQIDASIYTEIENIDSKNRICAIGELYVNTPKKEIFNHTKYNCDYYALPIITGPYVEHVLLLTHREICKLYNIPETLLELIRMAISRPSTCNIEYIGTIFNLYTYDHAMSLPSRHALVSKNIIIDYLMYRKFELMDTIAKGCQK